MQPDRILIVEDEKIIAFDLQRRLKSFGYEVVGQCTSGPEAIEAAGRLRPSLVLMDIMIEGEMDGIEAARQILEQFQISSIFLTAYSDEATLERAKASQPLGYILKPFKERELYSTLDMALFKAKIDSKIRDQDRWLSAILNSVTDGIIALDYDLNIHYLNPVAARLLGVEPDSVKGHPLTEWFSLLDDESLMPIKFLESGQEGLPVVQFKNAILQISDGQMFNIEGSITRVQFDQLPIGQVITFRDISAVKKLTSRIDHQARHDSLTGLLNRKEFTFNLTELFFDKVKAGTPCALVYLDLDQFKLINDTCGHLAGDELLRQTADIFRKSKDANVVAQARLGGDEFAILYENADTTQALEKAWVLKHSLNSHEFIWQNNVFKIKASFGLIPITPAYEDVKSILAAADDACYLAKEEGGNRIKVYETQDESFSRRRGEMKWINRLQLALERGEFVLFHQSIVPVNEPSSLRSKEELLIRLRGEDGKLIMPFDFIPAAERYNLMPQIDRWVVKTAISNYKRFQSEHHRDSMFCINLSGESVADPNLVSFIKNEMKKAEVAPENFCFEITETATIGNFTQAIAFIKDLKSIGCYFALDDFGSGFSSFAYLKNLPVDYLKIDGAFIKNLENDPISYAMVEAIYKISKVMGLKTIAEFVASKETRRLLSEIGIDYAQGYEVHIPSPMLDDPLPKA